MKPVLALLLLCALTACSGSSGSSAGETARSLDAISGVPDTSFGTLLNSLRYANGAGPVRYDARLGVAAQRLADDMLAGGFLSHRGSAGSTVGTRVTDAGYRWQRVGENIGRGQPNEEAILRSWVNSAGHQANNINPYYKDFALAKAGRGTRQVWVLVLGREF